MKMHAVGVFVPLLALTLVATTAAQSTSGSHNVVSGTVSKIDHAAKTVAVKSKDGATVVVHETDKTVKHGAAAAQEGGQAVAHYSAEAGKNVGHSVKHVGSKVFEVSKGVVTKVDAAAKTVTIKTAQGAEQVYYVAEDGVVSASKAAGHASAEAWQHLETATKKGAAVTIHYTQEGGRRVAHAFYHEG
jgi:arginine repressor